IPARAEGPRASAVLSVAIPVSDLDAAVEWYGRVLTFEKTREREIAGEDFERLTGVFGLRMRTATMRLGGETIELRQCLAPEGRPVPADSRSNDRWFQHVAIIVRDMDAAYARLRVHDVRHASSGPQTLPDWNPSAGGVSAFYFKDPDGHVLEVLRFPEGKGAARWHAPTDRLFLGIDHTAIVVADTERSLGFYRDALGLRVAGASENYGIEQERLNNVFGARLRITSLAPAAGPSVEFLEYLAPSGGRPYPAESGACDLWQWETSFRSPDAEGAARAIRAGGFDWISPGAVAARDGEAGFKKGVSARDPDGHAVRIVE
ncbi:MAG: VOC family protein, partial [Kofleriaceae bacterium]|nr:VOC family protein [Candidatus Methylomirabilis lanthanidiphila]